MGDRPKNRPAALFARPRALLVDDRPLRIDLPAPPPIDMAAPPAAPVPPPPPPEEEEEQAGPVRLFIGPPRVVAPARVRAGFDGPEADAEAEPRVGPVAPGRAALDLDRRVSAPAAAPGSAAAIPVAPARPTADLDDPFYEAAATAAPVRLPDRPFVASVPAPRRGDRSFAPRVPPRRKGFSPAAWAVAGVALVVVGLLGIWVQIRDQVRLDAGAPFPVLVEPAAPVTELPVGASPVVSPAPETAIVDTPAESEPVVEVPEPPPVEAPPVPAEPPPVEAPPAPTKATPPPTKAPPVSAEAPPVHLVGAPAATPSAPVVVRVDPPPSSSAVPAPVAATGVLRVTSNVAGRLYVDGKFKANIVDEAVLELPAGKHEIRLVPRGGRAMSQRVRVDPGVARGLAFEAR